MMYEELISTLLEYAEWADENIYEVPITLPDVLKKAADIIEELRSPTPIRCRDGCYLSRDDAKNRLEERINYFANILTGRDEVFVRAICNDVLSIPAADVVEVRHGHWIEQSPDFDLCGVAYYKCSECGKEQQLNSHYCQFCGAKMDKEVNE